MSRIVHLAIKVNDLEHAASLWQNVFGFTPSEVQRKRGHTSCHLTDGRFDLALIQYDTEETVEAGWAGAGPRIITLESPSRTRRRSPKTSSNTSESRMPLNSLNVIKRLQ